MARKILLALLALLPFVIYFSGYQNSSYATGTETTSLSITSNYNTMTPGGTLTLNVSVMNTTTSSSITNGTVTFSDGGGGGTFNPTSCNLSSGPCTVSYTASANPQSVTITAFYPGDSIHASSSNTLSITVMKNPTNTAILANQTTPVNPLGSVILSATVTDTS